MSLDMASKKKHRSNFPGKDLVEELFSLGGQLRELEQRAGALGLFTGHRELLECPQCGLCEDVTSDGRLITVESANK